MPAAILSLLPVVLSSIEELVKFFHSSADALKQSAELTPEQEAQLDALIAQAPQKDYWIPNE